MKRGIIRFVFLIFGFAIALSVLEIYLRMFLPQPTLSRVQAFTFPCFEQGEHRWIKLKSNATCTLHSVWDAFSPIQVQTNSLGLRNPEITLQKPDNTKRVLFVGDSFTMGWGVQEPESFARLTETHLKTRYTPQAVQTINAGFSAAGPSGYYIYLKYFGLELNPDVVVIGFYLGNDITGRKDVQWLKTDEKGLPDVVRSKSQYIDYSGQIRQKNTPIKYTVPYLRDSHAFMFFMDHLYEESMPSASDELLADMRCLFDPDCHDLDKAKQEVRSVFEGIQAILEPRGIKLVVMLIPLEFQINPNPNLMRSFGLPLLPSQRTSINKEFISFFDEKHIDYLDMLPILERHASEKPYLSRDDHWNAYGHKLASDAIAEKLLPLLQE